MRSAVNDSDEPIRFAQTGSKPDKNPTKTLFSCRLICKLIETSLAVPAFKDHQRMLLGWRISDLQQLHEANKRSMITTRVHVLRHDETRFHGISAMHGHGSGLLDVLGHMSLIIAVIKPDWHPEADRVTALADPHAPHFQLTLHVDPGRTAPFVVKKRQLQMRASAIRMNFLQMDSRIHVASSGCG